MRSIGEDEERDIASPPGVAKAPAIGGLRRGWRLVADLAGAPSGREGLRLRLAAGLERLADAARADIETGLAIPGLVVIFACGIALYFVLPREPWWPATVMVAVGTVAFTAHRRRRGHTARIAAMVAAVALGVAAASLETLRVAAPRLDHERTVTVEGRVVDVDATARGGLRMTIDVARMEGRGLTPETTPTRITATLTVKGGRPEVGDGVRFKARLKPPEGPVLPGGYDFARRAWFEGRGAGGYVLGRATIIDLGEPPLSQRLLQPIGALRHAIAERVRASLPGGSGTIAAAIMVGEQRAIPDAVNEPLRASGLTHIVSISGLHMSLVAGGVIVAIRGLLALFPLLALGYPIKKWAAGAALVAATIYLLLSGNQVAALRSHLMLSVALLAVMVDRPAITMHTIAVSAALILVWDPASALEPSFLMSYLAVIALVASYDLYRLWASRRPPPKKEEGLVAHLLGSGFRHVEGLAFSSLVAGLATAPVIAAVFFRGAPYSIIANMIVLPVTGMVIMPAAVVAALAMPFGLDHWPLQVMGLGIDFMVLIGRWAASLPAGAGLIGAPHAAMMPLGIAAVLWLSAWRSRIRLIGLVPAVAAIGLVFVGPRPDVMIGRHGAPVAVRSVDGRLHVLGTRQEAFDTAIWLAADGDSRLAADGTLAEGWACDPLGCVFRLSGDGRAGRPPPRIHRPPGRDEPSAASSAAVSAPPIGSGGRASAVDGDTSVAHGDAAVATPSAASASVRPPPDDPNDDLSVAVVRHPRAFAEDCRRAALVITDLVAPPGCRDLTTVIDRVDLAHAGAMAIDFTGAVFRRGEGNGDPTSDRRAADAPTTPGGSRSIAIRTSATIDPTTDEAGAPLPASSETTDSVDVARTGGDPRPVADPQTGEDPQADDDTATWTRRAIRVTASLPRFARPWTPVDPTVARLEREAETARAAAEQRRVDDRKAGSTSTSEPAATVEQPEEAEPGVGLGSPDGPQ